MYDIIIVGGGCAGLTAALYSARAGKKVLILEGSAVGGQITSSPMVDNYPGIAHMSGMEFADNLFSQVSEYGVELELDIVTDVKKDNDGTFTVTSDYGMYKSRKVIIASGVKHRSLGLENEEKLTGCGISYCAVCDGAFFKGKTVAIAGGGNTAVREALFLSDICAEVCVIHRRDTFRAETHLVEQMKQKENICLITDTVVKSVNGTEKLQSLLLMDKVTGEEKILEVSGLFVAVGHVPKNEAFKRLVELDEHGYIIADEKCRTSCEGVFAAGDCRVKEVRQLTTAAADGSIAALEAIK